MSKMNKFTGFLSKKEGLSSCLDESGEVKVPLIHPLAGEMNPETNKHFEPADIILDFLAKETTKDKPDKKGAA